MSTTRSLFTILLGVASAALLGACSVEAPQRSGTLTPLESGQADDPGGYRPYG